MSKSWGRAGKRSGLLGDLLGREGRESADYREGKLSGAVRLSAEPPSLATTRLDEYDPASCPLARKGCLFRREQP